MSDRLEQAFFYAIVIFSIKVMIGLIWLMVVVSFEVARIGFNFIVDLINENRNRR